MEHQPDAVIPLLFPEFITDHIRERNVEVLLPPRRTDRVYQVRSAEHGGEVIVHIEFEVSANRKMDTRLLIYHALLLHKYELPVHSMILYPFKVSMVAPPLVEMSGAAEVLAFKYEAVPLWKLDARTYIEKRAIPLYGLLPVMQGTSETLLLYAIDQMIEWYRDDDAHLRDELLCFRVLLARARRLPEAEFLHVKRRIDMFDPLLEEDPWFQEKVAQRVLQKQGEWEAKGRVEGETKGRVEGRVEGILEGLRTLLVKMVRMRFPSLADVAEGRAAQIADHEVLDALIEQVVQAANEPEARQALERPGRIREG